MPVNEHAHTQAHQRAIHLIAEIESTAAVISHPSCMADADTGLVNMFRVLLLMGQEDIAIVKFDQQGHLSSFCSFLDIWCTKA